MPNFKSPQQDHVLSFTARTTTGSTETTRPVAAASCQTSKAPRQTTSAPQRRLQATAFIQSSQQQ